MRSRLKPTDPKMIALGQEIPPQRDPCILAADRFNHAIVIQFDDGNCVRYSAKLLHSLISKLDEFALYTGDQ